MSIKGGNNVIFDLHARLYIILIIGLATGAYLLHAPAEWIGVGVLCLIGVAIIYGVKTTRQKRSAVPVTYRFSEIKFHKEAGRRSYFSYISDR